MSVTEFRVLQDGVERRAFAVRESPDGSLILIQKDRSTSFGTGAIESVTEMHVSAHSCRFYEVEGLYGHKFKTTSKTEHGDRWEQSSIVQVSRPRPKLLWPLDSAIMGDMSDSRFDVSKKSNLTVVQLIGYSALKEALQYTIFAHDPEIAPPQFQGFGVYTHRFKQMSLSVYVTFSDCTPDPETGKVFGALTGHSALTAGGLSKNGQLITSQAPIVRPLHTRKLEEILQAIHGDLARRYVAMELTKQGKRRVSSANFRRWPSIINADEMLYGHMARGKHEIYVAKQYPDGKHKPENARTKAGRMKILFK